MESPKEPGLEVSPISDAVRTEMLAEWNALRAEILKRMEMRHQVLWLALVVAGTLITFGAQEKVPVTVLLLYPLLATFLALAWTDIDIRISEIADFIRTRIEGEHSQGRLEGLRWEHYIRKKKREEITRNALARAVEISANGILVFTQLLALILAFPKMKYTLDEILLVLCDLAAVFLTIWLVRRRRTLLQAAATQETE